MNLQAVHPNARILIVDDNPANAALLEAILEEAGYGNLTIETDSRQVVDRHLRDPFDLILLDIRMPHLDGHQVMAALAVHQAPGDYLPVLVLTAQTDHETRQPALEEQVTRNHQLEQALRPALERGELELHYQPKLELASGRVCGAEALMRWSHPQWGMIPPGQFIPLAEQTGLIDEMGLWAIHRALEDAL